MPEGDSLRRAEQLLAPLLEGRRLVDVRFRQLRGGWVPRVGQLVEQVDAVGKHLLIHFDRQLSLDIHLGMAGRLRAVRGDVHDRPTRRVVLTVEGDDGVPVSAVCDAAPTVRTYLRNGPTTPVDHLGPDLSDDDADLDEVLRRAAKLDSTTLLADALLDQRVAAGVGNVFKSEALFVAGLHPFADLGSLDEEGRRRLWNIAHRQLVANRGTPYRSTTSIGDQRRTFVYGRHRLGCTRCDNAIEYDPAGGRSLRSTYWCPSCQAR